MFSLFSRIYSVIVRIRNAAYDRGLFRSRSVGVPVIAVGNITAGGTGKTPVVEFLLAYFLETGCRPAVVTRGYRRKSRSLVVVSDGRDERASVAESGDEPAQIARKFPQAVVIADAERVRGARRAVSAFGADVILLDDAFQHRAIARDLDIVVFDARQDPTDLRMLPAGRLREPLSGLCRAGLILLSRCPDADACASRTAQLRRWSDAPVVATTFHAQAFRCLDGATASVNASADIPPERFAGLRVLAFCGIGAPESFRANLTGLGIEVVSFHAFADHHWYSRRDIDTLLEEAHSSGVDILMTTEKDAMRLHAHAETSWNVENGMEPPDGDSNLRAGIYYPLLKLEIISGGLLLEERIRTLLARRAGDGD